MQSISYLPANDVLGHSAPLSFRALFPVLGVPVEFHSNSQAVLEVAEHALGHWRDVARDLVEPVEPRVVRLVVHPGARPYTPRAPFAHRAHSGCLLAASGDSMLMAQMERGEALGFVTPELVADEPHFRYNVVEAMALALASWRDRVPVHAGAVIHAGRAILLMGHSTAGKSTLCYACVRDGFQLLAEDVVYVSLSRGLRLWGNSRHIHLLPDAPRHFAELAGAPPRVQANGKLKLSIDVADLGQDRPRHHADRAAIVLLRRHAAVESALERLDPRAAVEALSGEREPGFDMFQSTRAAAEALAAGGVYQLTVGGDLGHAVALLRALAGGGGM